MRARSVIHRLLLALGVTIVLLGTQTVVAATSNPLSGLGADNKAADAHLEQSLAEVIRTLENDQERSELLKKLKQLHEVTPPNGDAQGGMLGLIRDTVQSVEQQFEGSNSPLERWSHMLHLARTDLNDHQGWALTFLDFGVVLLIWSCMALGLRWLARRMGAGSRWAGRLPRHPAAKDLLVFFLRKLGPWLIAFLVTLYLSAVTPDSPGKLLALVVAYVLVCGILFASLCVISLSLLGGEHRMLALDILRQRAFAPLWVIGSLAMVGDVMQEPQVMGSLGHYITGCVGALANILAALLTGGFALQFRRPVSHLICNQPLQRRLKNKGLQELIALVGRYWFLPVLILVIISLLATLFTAGDSGYAMRRALPCALLLIMAMTVSGLIHRLRQRATQGNARRALYAEKLLGLGFTLVHIASLLLFFELGLRFWGISVLGFSDGQMSPFGLKLLSFGGTVLGTWLIWILADTALQHSLGLGGKSRSNTRALTMLPLIRNIIFVTIAVIGLIVALANMGVNVTPLLAGAGVIGLAIGFGAQSLVADLITGMFIIIEDSLSIDDYVDVGGHLGTVEGLTIRTVRLRDLDGVVHTIPFSEIKSIKNYSRQFGYAMFRWPVPSSMPIDNAVSLVREVASELGKDLGINRNIWSPLEMQGIESFDNGQAILRFRFKTAPVRQWEVQRAFNMRLRQKLDLAGLEPSMPRLNVQLSRMPKPAHDKPDANACTARDESCAE